MNSRKEDRMMSRSALGGITMWMMVVVLLILPAVSHAAEKGGSSNKVGVALWVGYGLYGMDDFNGKLTSEGNEIIDGGLSLGLEVEPMECKIPKEVPMVGGQSIKLPFGIEYLNAASKTTHVGDDGGATVEWNLPVVGVYVAPNIPLAAIPQLAIRPISIGYYALGNAFDASLTISDRPGRLELSGQAVGIKTEVAVQQPVGGSFSLFARAGYRWLKFADIDQTPRGGFSASVGGPPVQAGSLQEDVDYSGLIGEFGLTASF